ncbi:hypothetical protein NPA31_011700 [Aurantimonas sp. MSK8Z-1]|uniref:hypothetical protein n=1 Tax=Mangrovibrevibacter kandeliae TaxID=2968473 RepID=UPI0021190832|nr:hypothetical protein [Aurantimonas sp. MSK8Z-1]MCW4115627.1 hypothetical protein [Aurantimonas sp. MSK8Z-1]
MPDRIEANRRTIFFKVCTDLNAARRAGDRDGVAEYLDELETLCLRAPQALRDRCAAIGAGHRAWLAGAALQRHSARAANFACVACGAAKLLERHSFGDNTARNVVIVCANCHRLAHGGKAPE